MKVIHRVTTPQGFVKYYTYVFVGKRCTVLPTLKKVRDKGLLQTLESLSAKEVTALADFFGVEPWYECLFNKRHVEEQLALLRKDPGRLQRLSEKLEGLGSPRQQEGGRGAPPRLDPSSSSRARGTSVVLEDEDVRDNESLKDHVSKIFIEDHLVPLDDTVATLKKKVCDCVSFPDLYLTPTRLYLWGESGEGEAVPVGSRWEVSSETRLPVVPDKDVGSYTNLNTEELVTINTLFEKYAGKFRRVDENHVTLEHYVSKGLVTGREVFCTDVYSTVGRLEPSALTSEGRRNLVNTLFRLYYPLSVTSASNVLSFLSGVDTTTEPASSRKVFFENRSELRLKEMVVHVVENERRAPKGLGVLPPKAQVVSFEGRLEVNHWVVFNKVALSEAVPYASVEVNGKHYEKKLKRDSWSSPAQFQRFSDLLPQWSAKRRKALCFKLLSPDLRYATLLLNPDHSVRCKVHLDHAALESSTVAPAVVADFLRHVCAVVGVGEAPTLKPVLLTFTQKVRFPQKLSHKGLSEFARHFYPYVAVYSQQKKAHQWTFMRYKRVSNYESEAVVSKRALEYLKTLQLTRGAVEELLQKEFDLTVAEAKRYVSAAQSALKSPSGEQPTVQTRRFGAYIEVLGNWPQPLTVRVAGVSTLLQAKCVSDFVQRLLFLYHRVFVKGDKGVLAKLQANTASARERDYVQELTYFSRMPDSSLTALRLHDPTRFGSSSYVRECQNSGTTVRRPTLVRSEEELVAMGYQLDPQSGFFRKGDAVAFPSRSASGVTVYYVCDPKVNGEFKYVGVLTKLQATDKPCCFKKNQLESQTRSIRARLLQALQQKGEQDYSPPPAVSRYVRKWKKITHERVYEPPDAVAVFFAASLGVSSAVVVGLETTLAYPLLVALTFGFQRSYLDLLAAIKSELASPRGEYLFTYVNFGDVRRRLGSVGTFVDHLASGSVRDDTLLELVEKVFGVSVVAFRGETLACSEPRGDRFLFTVATEKAYYPVAVGGEFLVGRDTDVGSRLLAALHAGCPRVLTSDVSYYSSLASPGPVQQVLSPLTFSPLFLTYASGSLLPVLPLSRIVEELPLSFDAAPVPLEQELRFLSEFPWLRVKEGGVVYSGGKPFVRVFVLSNSPFAQDASVDVPVVLPPQHPARPRSGPPPATDLQPPWEPFLLEVFQFLQKNPSLRRVVEEDPEKGLSEVFGAVVSPTPVAKATKPRGRRRMIVTCQEDAAGDHCDPEGRFVLDPAHRDLFLKRLVSHARRRTALFDEVVGAHGMFVSSLVDDRFVLTNPAVDLTVSAVVPATAPRERGYFRGELREYGRYLLTPPQPSALHAAALGYEWSSRGLDASGVGRVNLAELVATLRGRLLTWFSTRNDFHGRKVDFSFLLSFRRDSLPDMPAAVLGSVAAVLGVPANVVDPEDRVVETYSPPDGDRTAAAASPPPQQWDRGHLYVRFTPQGVEALLLKP